MAKYRALGLELVRWTAFLLLALAGTATVVQGQDQAGVINREYAIKAAFLYHFSTYVTWPTGALPDKSQPFVIGVYQTNPFGTSLEKIAKSKTVAGHPIEIRRVTSPDEVSACQVIFVPESVRATELGAVFKAAQDSPVLIVGETTDFVERGGGVQFFVEGNKVRFAISVDMTKRDDLKLSSKLLSLAKIVPKG